MRRKDYENYKWYPVTDDTYWVNEYPDEFPNCETIVCWKPNYDNSIIYTRSTVFLGWGTMAKSNEWYFMIIEKC